MSGNAMLSPYSFQSTAQSDDELDLVRRAAGDPQAFALLYRQYVESIYRYCYRRLGSKEASEDATQIIFEKAIAALPRIDPNSPFRAWLFTIAHNTVIDIARAHRHARTLDDIAEFTIFDPAPTPEDMAIELDERDRLSALIRQLPDRERRLLDLRIAGLNDREIADVMGMSHGAVRTAQYRALQKLKGMMASDTDRKLAHVLA
jgi:RNA polymerase sigma-70 factor (ECF subfamily)